MPSNAFYSPTEEYIWINGQCTHHAIDPKTLEHVLHSACRVSNKNGVEKNIVTRDKNLKSAKKHYSERLGVWRADDTGSFDRFRSI